MHSAFEKSKTLFGISSAAASIKEKDSAYVVEGPTDVMRWHEHKIDNTVGKQGSDFSEDQARILKRYCGTVCFVPDNDADKGDKNPGLKSLERNAEVAIKAGLIVKVLIPGIGASIEKQKKQ
jgi:DNA primase